MLWKQTCSLDIPGKKNLRPNYSYTKKPNPTRRRPQNGLALPLVEERLYPIYLLRERAYFSMTRLSFIYAFL